MKWYLHGTVLSGGRPLFSVEMWLCNIQGIGHTCLWIWIWIHDVHPMAFKEKGWIILDLPVKTGGKSEPKSTTEEQHLRQSLLGISNGSQNQKKTPISKLFRQGIDRDSKSSEFEHYVQNRHVRELNDKPLVGEVNTLTQPRREWVQLACDWIKKKGVSRLGKLDERSEMIGRLLDIFSIFSFPQIVT